MAKSKRDVLFFSVSTGKEKVNFEDLLCSDLLTGKSFEHNDKVIEYSNNRDHEDDYVTGVLVATKVSGIPPRHLPSTEDYEQVTTKKGEGLAYPSVLLYSKKHKVLLFEVNGYGASVDQFQLFLQKHLSNKGNFPGLFLQFTDLLSEEGYQMIRNGVSEMLSFKITNPTGLLDDELKKNGSLAEIAKFSKNAKADSYIECKIRTEAKYGGISPSFLDKMIKSFKSLRKVDKEGVTKVKLSGLVNSNGVQRVKEIDVFEQLMRDKFVLNEPTAHTDIQLVKRVGAIINIFEKKRAELDRILGT